MPRMGRFQMNQIVFNDTETKREKNKLKERMLNRLLGFLSGQMNVTPFDSRFQYITHTHLSS